MTRPRLVVFDVDGTLVDSQAAITGAMEHAFAAVGRSAPDRRMVLSIVGLSLERAVAALAPDLAEADRSRAVDAYRGAFAAFRQHAGAAAMPLYPGALGTLHDLAARPGVILGVATGKSRRGLDAVIEAHRLGGLFATLQVADDHPSKPHPSMILAAMAETGIGPGDTVMIGDTAYDIEMAAAAGVPALGVNWGYHPPEALAGARAVLGSFADLRAELEALWRAAP